MFELFGKKQVVPKALYSIYTELHPYSLKPNKSDFADLEITVVNNSGSELLTAIIVTVPKGLGFERSAISHEKEVRLGYLTPNAPQHVKVQIWGTERTERGAYLIRIFSISHYKDYAHVLNEARKELDFRVG